VGREKIFLPGQPFGKQSEWYKIFLPIFPPKQEMITRAEEKLFVFRVWPILALFRVTTSGG
jgi:hypothetical protein